MASKRFAVLTDEQKKQILEDSESANTKRCTLTGVNVFKDYLNSKELRSDFIDLPKSELDELLRDFYFDFEARNKQGDLYKKGTLIGYRYAIQRHLENKRTVDRINIMTDAEFIESKKAFKSVIKDLKRQGKAATDHYPPISDSDLQKAYAYLTEGHLEDAKLLQYKVFLDIMLHIGRRGRENLAVLSRQDFAATQDENGSLYVYQCCDEQTKNHQQDSERSSDGRMYEIKGQAETGDCGWSFQCRVDCPTYPNGDNVTNVSRKRSYKRTQHVPVCDVTSVTINVMTRNDTHIPAFPFNDSCLPRIVDEHCYDDFLVPRVVHYVWFGKREMGFYHFLSFWSAYTFLKPCFIFVHSDYLPFGDYWDILLMHVPNLIHVNRSQPLYIYGTRVKHVEHSADLVRLEALQAFGGIYIDTDVIILRPFEPLRRYNFTLSREMSNSLSNALIISVRNATFSSYWLKEYRHFYADQWADHSTLVPARLAKAHKDDIHIEEYTFYRPDWTQAKKWIYQKNYVWKTNYAMHLYIRQAPTAHTLADIRTLNTTLGSVARFTLFGIKELCIV